MKKTIRFKIFITFVLLIVAFQAAFLVVNAFFLDNIYVQSSEGRMTQVYEDIKNRNGEAGELEAFLREASRDNGVTMTLVEKGIVTATTSFDKRPDGALEITPLLLKRLDALDRRMGQDMVFFIHTGEGPLRKRLILIGRLGDRRYLIMEKPFAVIEQNALVARRFIWISGILTLLLGSVAIYFAAGRMSRPVEEMTRAAQAIAGQDFSRKVSYDADDELGDLGKSINRISRELDGALTDLKEANAKLTEDIERERRLERMRRLFVSSVSHELKNPIAMIRAYADGLIHGIARDPRTREEYAGVIVDESEKMDRLIRDLLDLSAYEAGTFTLEKTRFDLAEAVRDLASRQTPLFQEKAAGLRVEAPGQLFVLADRLRVEQILLNFLGNALRHVQAGGRVELLLEARRAYARLTVFNTGLPIPEEELPNLWDSFYKGRGRGSDPAAGTGLGLAVVKAITELHEGACGVENRPGGVAFWAEVPFGELREETGSI